MNIRERFHAIMNFEPFDRLPICELAIWWTDTIKRWQKEGGLPKHWDRRKNYIDIARHFDLDLFQEMVFFMNRSPQCPQPEHYGGGIVADKADYERIHPCLFPENPVDYDYWRQWKERQDADEAIIWFDLLGYFWFPRELFGIERHFTAFYDHPELMKRMNEEVSYYHIHIIEEICTIVTPDFMMFSEDMSYNHGPMLSKDLFDEFMLPYYQKVIPELKKRGIIVFVDSDGDISEAIPWFKEAGVDGIWLLERQAGVDLAKLREEHPKFRFMGHFDKMTMTRGEAAMRAEFERLVPIAAQGGYIINVDHQTPPGVSYQDYLLYLKLFREYAQKAGELSQQSLAK